MRFYKTLAISSLTAFILTASLALAESGDSSTSWGGTTTATSPVVPVTPTHNSAWRQNHQAERIGAGLVNTSISPLELKRLKAEQKRIEEMKAAGASEADIQAEQNKASKQIQRLKHNDSKKFGSDVRNKDYEKDLANFEQRLGNGSIDGSLTAEERTRVAAAIARMKNLKAKLAANGNLSAAEGQELEAKENAISKMIYRNRHDAEGVQLPKAAIPAQ